MLENLRTSNKNQIDISASEFSILNFFDVHNTSSIQEIRRNIRKGLRGMQCMPEVYTMLVTENPNFISYDQS